METLESFHKKYIKGTIENAIVTEKIMALSSLTEVVKKKLGLKNKKVYISTRALKHLYDKKPAEFYDFAIKNLFKIVRYPDHIYKNKDGKRGSFCFTKRMENRLFFVSIEIENNEEIKEDTVWVVTSYEIKKDGYLKNYELLWSWKDDIPSS